MTRVGTAEKEIHLSDLIDEAARKKSLRRSSFAGGVAQRRTSNGFRRSSLGNNGFVTGSIPSKGVVVPNQIKVRRLSSTCGGSYNSNPSRDTLIQAFEAMEREAPLSKEISFRRQSQGDQDRARLVSSINWLALHVPICVLDRLMEEVRETSHIAERSRTAVPEKSIVIENEDHDASDIDSLVSDISQDDLLNPGTARSPSQMNAHSEIDGAESDTDSGFQKRNKNQPPLHLTMDPSSSRDMTESTDVEPLINHGHNDVDAQVKRMPRRNSLEHLKMSRGASRRSVGSTADRRQSLLRKERRETLERNGPTNAAQNDLPLEAQPKLPMRAQDMMRTMSGRKGQSGSGDFSTGSHIFHASFSSGSCSIMSFSSGVDGRELAMKACGIGTAPTTSAASFIDPFPFDSDDERQHQARHGRTQQPLRRNAAIQESERTRNLFKSGDGNSSHQWRQATLPYARSRESALLFVDISGFTKLSTLLDPESLSKAINSYFERIINEIIAHGGDVLKFAGDAIFAEWRVCVEDDIDNATSKKGLSTLGECVVAAASCGSKIVADCADFPIFGSSAAEQLASLNVHCGLGAGKVVGIHVGDQEARREFVILGDPINQLADASHNAHLGELVASPEALKFLTDLCSVNSSLVGKAEPAVIARRRSMSMFEPFPAVKPICEPDDFFQGLHSHVDKDLSNDGLKLFRKLLALYAHPVVVANDSSILEIPRSSGAAEERHREEAELRSVYVMFITPLIGITVSGDEESDNALYSLLNDIMNLATRELKRFSGHLRQFIVDDKGVVLIATFGLRGSTFPNMVAERALPCTIVIHNALVNDLGVQNQIGATIGNAYCGVVGGINRHEYAVMGPSVNLAARLMGSPKNPGILVDNAVRMMADKSYGFNALAPVKAKGYSEPVPIFEPLSPLERSFGRVHPNFVGRRDELKVILKYAREMAVSDCATRMIIVEGENGIGKSTMVVHAIEHIRRVIRASRRRLIITKSVGKESDQLVPFGMFSAILLDVLQFCKAWASDDRSLASRGGSIQSLNSLDWESLSAGSHLSGGTTGTYFSRTAERLAFICREMNAPPEFAELVGHHLLGFDIPATKKSKGQRNAGTMKNLISFMTRAFLRCTQDATLVVIALDDVQNMDEMSWKVVQDIFETTGNILLICTKRPENECTLPIDKNFWEKLNNGHEKNQRFTLITLDKLSEDEISQMIAKTLGLQTKDISSKLHHNVFTQSQGMPHFANEILESMKRRTGEESQSESHTSSHDTGAFASVGELILHRIDSFSASVRNVLNIGAVLGSTFELIELIAVLRQIVGGDDADQLVHIIKTREALELAVDEGILFLIRDEGEDLTGSEKMNESGGQNSGMASAITPGKGDEEEIENPQASFSFAFCHEIWRSTILKLMLDGRQRDIHRIIATTLEDQLGSDANDYLTRMKLFSHWKASGELTKAAALALAIGRSYEDLGMHNQSIRLYKDALGMWRPENLNGDTVVDNFTQQSLDNLSGGDVENIITLYNALGKALANIQQSNESINAYQYALGVLKYAKVANEMTDRSFVFPVFSGLFVAIKFDQIEQDEECSYEQDLVAQFVEETKKLGDPVHVARALAMQAEILGRLGMFEGGLEVFEQMCKIYIPERYSSEICHQYGSDRAAQTFGLAALWQMALGEPEKALEICQRIVSQLMPKMDGRNVHNSCLIVYPILWVLKDCGYPGEARNHFDHFVVTPFQTHYGEGASTSCLPIYDPILVLLDLAAGDVDNEAFQAYLDWAADGNNLKFGSVMNNAMGHYGRCPDSISAEICLLLAQRMQPGEDKLHLIQAGLDVILEVVTLTQKKKMIIARNQALPVYRELMALAKGLVVDDGSRQPGTSQSS